MKETNYIVQESVLMPDKVIYAGIMTKPDSTGMCSWKTRKDVTQLVQNAFIMHYVAKTNKHIKDSGKNGAKWTFNLDDFDIELIIKKKTNTNTEGTER